MHPKWYNIFKEKRLTIMKEEKQRLQVHVDKTLVDGVESKLKEAGLDQSSVLSAFLTYVAHNDKLPFKATLTAREIASAEAAAVFAKNTEEIPEIQSEKDIVEWYTENGDDYE